MSTFARCVQGTLYVYRPQRDEDGHSTTSRFLDAFSDLLSRIHNKCVFIGDFNFHVDILDDCDTKRLNLILSDFNFTQHVSFATHKDGHSLDLLITKTDDDRCTNLVQSVFISDHCSFIFDFRFPGSKSDRFKREQISYRKLNAIEPNAFSTCFVDNIGSSFFLTKNANAICNEYNSALSKSLDKLAPRKTKTVTIRPKRPWMTSTILAAKRIRRKAERIWRRKRSKESRTVFKKECKHVKDLMDTAVTDYFKNQIANCDGDQRKLFSIVNNVLDRKISSLPKSQSPLALANDFVAFFKTKIEGICRALPPVDVSLLVDTSTADDVAFDSFKLMSQEDLCKIIMAAPKSTCSLDPVPTRFLLDDLETFLPFITHIVNVSLETGVFPDTFKNAYVRPLLKKPTLDSNVLKNYRPVSNLSFLSKIVERVVAGQIQRHMDLNSLNNPMQSAYRQGHSCETAVLKVHNDICQALDKGFVVIHVMLDLSAAFDTLDHRILLYRLQTILGVKGIALEWFRSYLAGRSQQVVINGSVSSKSELNIGVPQGSVLGPILFNIYTLPLYELARDNDNFSHFYADDSQLYVVCNIDSIESSFSSIESCVSIFKAWMMSNRLKLNGDKTELTVFAKPRTDSRIRPVLPVLSIENVPIQPQSDCKVLGSFFDSKLSMDVHVSQFCKSANYHINNIYSIRKYLDFTTTEALVHAFVSSRLDYCNSLLFGITKQQLSRLQKIQNRAARLCLSIPRRDRVPVLTLLRTLHWLPVSFRIDFKILLLTFKCLNGLAPTYLSELLSVRNASRTTRSAGEMLLDIPKSNTKSWGDRSFAVCAPRLWNGLPLFVRSAESVSSFKSTLKSHLFRLAFNC